MATDFVNAKGRCAIPVVYAQPEFDENIAQAYAATARRGGGGGGGGGGDISAGERLRAQQAAWAIGQRAVENDAQIGERAREFDAVRQDRANAFNAEQMYSVRDEQQDRADMAKQAQRAELQDWMGQREVSHAEQIKAQRLEQSITAIEASPLLRPEKDDLILQARTGLDPIRQRLEQQQLKQQENMLRKSTEEAKFLAAISNTDAAVRTTAFNQRRKTIVNPTTGQPEEFYLNSKGDLEAIPFSKPSTGDGEGREKKQEFDQWFKMHTAYSKALSDEVSKVDKDNQAGVKNTGLTRATNDEIVAQAVRNLADPARGVQNPGPMPGQQSAQQAAPSAQPPAAAPPASAPSQTLPPKPAPPTDEQVLAQRKPINRAKPDSWTTSQRKEIGEFQERKNLVNQRDLPRPVKDKAIAAYTRLEAIYAASGGGAITEAEAREAKELNEFLKKVVAPSATEQAANAQTAANEYIRAESEKIRGRLGGR